MEPIERRRFLARSVRGAAAAAATVSAFEILRPGARGANDRVVLAVAGAGGQGTTHAKAFNVMADAQVVAVCDPDTRRRTAAAKAATREGKEPKPVEDFRTLLDDKGIHAFAVATPDHWHALITVLACQAGKDVYVEKPCSHNVREGQLMIEAARKYQRIVQHGTQSRSGAAHQEAVETLRSGKLGRCLQAKAINSQRRANIGRKPDAEPPAGVNYDLWLGPAPKRPFNPNRFHYNWHWMWDTGTGDIGNDGIHQIDVARWGLGVEVPTRVSCSAGKYFFDDDQETPDTYLVTYEFPADAEQKRPACTLVYEQRDWAPYHEHEFENGVVFYCEKGYIEVSPATGLKLFTERNKPLGAKPESASLPAHHRHFVECVKTRKRSRADIEVGHRSALLAHLGNIAYRVGRDLRLDPKAERFVGDDEANKLLTRTYRAPYLMPDPV
ncbi:MAG TPA: Gfo/Idh/MocA family oxidoreductase [Planctomycetota bacterium]|nr:Gfo/Idh/MocA family oxidoreductase [Planctomycetota bacterium]